MVFFLGLLRGKLNSGLRNADQRAYVIRGVRPGPQRRRAVVALSNPLRL
ncbi:hypothetical protein GCM10010393_41700 [Streptomyces gobitricini]|uniref:Uncharacterized protein n=1 Tax=Streptomyces gobitricini TaxID=68211 RepID=A0ABP5ZWA5_9ACTN